MAFLDALGSVFSIVIMIALGYFLTHKKWIDEENAKVFAKLITNIGLPTMMINNLMINFDKEKLLDAGKGLFVPFASIALSYLCAKVFCRIFRVREGRQGAFQSIFFVSNTIYMGLPVNLALFGEQSVPYVLLYYIANTTFFWTIGVYEISRDGKTGGAKLFSKATLKRIISPPLLGFSSAIVLILLGIKLPSFILDSCRYLGNITTPLSMIFIGNTIYYVDLKGIKVDKDMIGALIGRFVISPILVLIVILVYPLPPLMKNVFTVQAAMPAMTNTAIMSRIYDADYKYAAVMVAISTLLSVLVIPIYKVLLT